MKKFQEDSRVGIDLTSLSSQLPSLRACENGVVDWIVEDESGHNDTGNKPLPVLVIGAGRDFIIDRKGVEETAIFLGTEPIFIEEV